MKLPEADAAAREWLQLDREPSTVHEVEHALAQPDAARLGVLRGMFGSRMKFGTAGLRARMGAGTARMNDLTVIQTTQGLLRYVQRASGKPAVHLVVGHDARHNSARWARRIAAVCRAAGCAASLFTTIVPTPLVPFAVNRLGADAGVMVTASHNPKTDNGYKVYWSNGVQIIPPHDAGIQKEILENLVPWGPAVWDLAPQGVVDVTYLKEPYLRALLNLPHGDAPSASEGAPPVFAYTAMHGVGLELLLRAFQTCGLPAPAVVASQAQPDPEFPTVAFPNPEEPGALDDAFDAADDAGARVVLANDPDADRLAAAEKQADGSWRVFSGNELGVLLGTWAWERSKRDGPKAMLASMVSSRFLGTIGKAEGFGFEVTQTGFKWLGNRAAALAEEGTEVLFAFEEAIGYMHSATGVRDKDGISAAVALGHLVQHLAARGETLASKLAELQRRHGFHANRNSYFISHDPAVTAKLFGRLRDWKSGPTIEQNGARFPARLGGYDVSSVEEVPVGAGSFFVVLTFLGGKARLSLRTSGTEPKIKFYSELVGRSADEAQRQLDALVEAVVAEAFEPAKHRLLTPEEAAAQARKKAKL